jgi:CDP-diacylglycerol--glycerol-3-phosphate 3-phosphatidyltransferase
MWFWGDTVVLETKHRLFKPRPPQAHYSEANIVTLLRMVASLSFFVLAMVERNPTYNYIGLTIHWGGDILDGFLARRFGQETVFGAEIDIIADRVETLAFFIVLLSFRPGLLVPVIIYTVNFALVDFYLSFQFVKYDIISPNYFYKVDRLVYLLNYTRFAKFCNSSLVVLLMLFLPGYHVVPATIACILIGVKMLSIYMLSRHTCPAKRVVTVIRDKHLLP